MLRKRASVKGRTMRFPSGMIYTVAAVAASRVAITDDNLEAAGEERLEDVWTWSEPQPKALHFTTTSKFKQKKVFTK